MDGKGMNAVLWVGVSIVIHRMLCSRSKAQERRDNQTITVSAPGKALIGTIRVIPIILVMKLYIRTAGGYLVLDPDNVGT